MMPILYNNYLLEVVSLFYVIYVISGYVNDQPSDYTMSYI